MTLIGLLVTLVIFGVLLYIVGLIPMDGTVKRIVYALAILILVLWLLAGFGLIDGTLPRFGRAR